MVDKTRPTLARSVLYYQTLVNTWQLREARRRTPSSLQILACLSRSRAMVTLMRQSDGPDAGRAAPGSPEQSVIRYRMVRSARSIPDHCR